MSDEQLQLFGMDSRDPGATLFRRVGGLQMRKEIEAVPKLSPRELDVLLLFASGKKARAIARELGISKGVVRNYSLSARRKLGACSTINAVYIASEMGLLKK